MLKKLLIVTGIIGLFIVLFMVSFNSLAKHIYNRTDCERFNIDNVEVRTGIDIPSIIDATCSSNGKIKNSIFTIDTNKVDINTYIKTNKFVKEDSIYINTGESKNTKWKITLNPESAILNVSIEYKSKA